MEGIEAVPIGFVQNSVKEPRPFGWETVESRIELTSAIDPAALRDLDGFSHILVIFWLHQLTGERPRPATLAVGRDSTPRGIFATRSQLRPTPLGCSVVRLLTVEQRMLRVRGLDAIDATPVLDLKPYIPEYDSVADAITPAWIYGPS